jgi:uncharacterized protein DUF4255/carboxypeptidase family protein
MIRDLSESLAALLDDPALSAEFPELSSATIAFDRPVDGFNPGQTTVDLFLYDVRENMELRSNEPLVTRANGGVAIHPAPLRIACSYLVTAWPVGGTELPLQEHRLLGQALRVLSRHPQIPASALKGQLVGQQPPLPMMTARTDGLKEPHEFWAAIGNKMRASIVVTATIGMDLYPPVTASEVITSQVQLGQARFRIGGRVTTSGAAVMDASVTLVELGFAAATDGDGRYQLGAMAAGTYTIRVRKGTTEKSRVVTVPSGPGADYNIDL